MDDFVGTSIQFAEQEILRLEREHAAEMEQTANELIEKGFLDTDYEDSETESTDYSDSPRSELSEPISDDESLHIAPSEVALTSDATSMIESDDPECNVDVDDERESESESDYELESRLRHILSARRVSLQSLIETIVSDIRGIAMMVLLLVVLQMSNERTDDHFDDDDSYDECAGPRLHRHTKIQYYWRGALNDGNDGDEKHEEDEEEEEETQTLNFDVTTTLFDATTNMVIQSKSFGHAIRVNDLFCDDEVEPTANAHVRDVARNMYSNGPCRPSSQVNEVMFVPRLLLQFGAGMKSPQMMRIFKETVADSGRHLVRNGRNHGLTALVMSFAGIAAVTAAGGLDDLL